MSPSPKSSAMRRAPAGENKKLDAKRIWGMPILLTVLSSIALVVGLLADGWVDVVAWGGLGVPILVTVWHVGRAMRA